MFGKCNVKLRKKKKMAQRGNKSPPKGSKNKDKNLS